MPDDISKAIDYVLVMLPGFICIGIVSFFTDLELSEFHFIYLSLALSLLFNFLGKGIIWAGSKVFKAKQGASEQNVSFKQRVPVIFVLCILVSGLITYWYENDTALSIIRNISFFDVEKVDHRRPLAVILNDFRFEEKVLHSDGRGPVQDPETKKLDSSTRS